LKSNNALETLLNKAEVEGPDPGKVCKRLEYQTILG
jgi:hypothetical protein